MTAPNGPILFNSSTGSDTLSSGLGPATPVNGAGASTTAASAVVTGIDTTGVSAGDLLWVLSTSDRQFSIIATVDGPTQVTCDDTFANTESGRTWAIGGKRATFDNTNSRTIFGSAGAKGGWTIETETDQTISTTAIDLFAGGSSTAGDLRIVGTVGAVRVLRQSSNVPIFSSKATTIFQGFRTLKNLGFQNTQSVSKSNSQAILFDTATNANFMFIDCVFGDQTNTLESAFNRVSQQPQIAMIDCEIKYCTGNGIGYYGGGQSTISAIRLNSHHNTGHGAYILYAAGSNFTNFIDSFFWANGGDGIFYGTGGSSGSFPVISGCVFHANSGSGLVIDYYYQAVMASVSGNVFTSNGLYAIEGSSITNDCVGVDRNAYLTNANLNVTAGPNDITLTANPFVDAANGNFNLNNVAGGGALLRASQVAL